MKASHLIIAGILFAVAMVLVFARLGGDAAAPLAFLVEESKSTAPRLPAKSHARKPVEHRFGTAMVKHIDHENGLVVLSLERGKFAEGNVGYLERRGENGGLLKLESIVEREAVANIEQVDSTQLVVGDFVMFSPELVQLTNFNIDFAQVEWFSE